MAMTASCALLAAHCAQGEWADLRNLDAAQRVVPASFIRQLMLGLPIARAGHERIAAARSDYAAQLPAGDWAGKPWPPTPQQSERSSSPCTVAPRSRTPAAATGTGPRTPWL